MKKKIIVAAVAAAMVAPLAAMADATVYGKVRVGTVYHDRDNDNESWELEDESSRLGIKGSEDLGNGLKAIYKMEFGVKVGDTLSSSSSVSGRNAYVGLAGDWGTFLWGRHDTPHKMSTGKLDFFQDTTADSDDGNGGKHIGLFDDNRAQDAIVYISPNFSGFTIAATAIQDGGTDDFADGYSIAGTFSQGPWYAAVSYEELQDDHVAGDEDDTKWRVGLGILGMAGFSASIIYEDREDADGVAGADNQSWMLSGAYDFGNNRIKALYGEYDDDSAADNGDFDAWAIGFQHNFSKRTDVQIIYRAKDYDDMDEEDNTFALQLNHSF